MQFQNDAINLLHLPDGHSFFGIPRLEHSVVRGSVLELLHPMLPIIFVGINEEDGNGLGRRFHKRKNLLISERVAVE
jgi:hypothetical protein